MDIRGIPVQPVTRWSHANSRDDVVLQLSELRTAAHRNGDGRAVAQLQNENTIRGVIPGGNRTRLHRRGRRCSRDPVQVLPVECLAIQARRHPTSAHVTPSISQRALDAVQDIFQRFSLARVAPVRLRTTRQLRAFGLRQRERSIGWWAAEFTTHFVLFVHKSTIAKRRQGNNPTVNLRNIAASHSGKRTSTGNSVDSANSA